MLWGACRVVYCIVRSFFLNYCLECELKYEALLWFTRITQLYNSSRGPFGECVTSKWLVYCFIYVAKKLLSLFMVFTFWNDYYVAALHRCEFILMVDHHKKLVCTTEFAACLRSCAVCAGFLLTITLASSINWTDRKSALHVKNTDAAALRHERKVNKRRK